MKLSLNYFLTLDMDSDVNGRLIHYAILQCVSYRRFNYSIQLVVIFFCCGPSHIYCIFTVQCDSCRSN